MEFSGLAMAGGFMAVLGVSLAGLLAFANRKLYEAVSGEVVPAQCTVSSPEQRDHIADLLGVSTGDIEKKVARLACAGGRHVAFLRARYAGHDSCRAAAVVSGGGKECAWGCLGLADCMNVCDFGAIHMDLHGLPVVDADKCAACNDCVEVCPKGLFSLEPVSRQLWVACKSQADGDTAEAACEVACTACGKCVADAPPGLMKLAGNLAAINYELNVWATKKPIERCPTGAIVWFENPNRPVRGAVAKKILRNEPLPVLH